MVFGSLTQSGPTNIGNDLCVATGDSDHGLVIAISRRSGSFALRDGKNDSLANIDKGIEWKKFGSSEMVPIFVTTSYQGNIHEGLCHARGAAQITNLSQSSLPVLPTVRLRPQTHGITFRSSSFDVK